MPVEVQGRVSYRFADFEVHSDCFELLRDGVRLKLREQPFRILVLLLERAGELVSRDDLRLLLWPQDTFVDFDKGLNTSVNRLREALRDSATQPRFIETVPRHGYRFIAPVRRSAPREAPAIATAPEVPLNPSADVLKVPKTSANRLVWPWLLALALCMAAALALIFYGRQGGTPALGTPVQLTNDGIAKNELVTDGVRVFYAAPTGRGFSNWSDFEVPLSGGEARPLATVGEPMSPFAISADHSELMLGPSVLRQSNDFATPDRLWTQPLAGGPARALPLGAQDAAWSPDGNRIVYASEQHIGLARADGTTIRMLADVPGLASGLRWSPKSDAIRFTLHYGPVHKDAAIWELSPETGHAHPLFPNSKNRQTDGEWTPDNRFYLFSQTTNGVSQIWALPEPPRLGKSQAVQLINGPMQTFLPTPTPDGKRILFYGVSKRSQILEWNGKSGRLESFLPGISGASIDFSKDGNWICYQTYPEKSVWRAAADGSQRLQLSPPDMTALFPVMSPDGTRVAFLGWFPDQPFSVFVVDRDGSNLRALTHSGEDGIAEPSWSPDSRSLVLGMYGRQDVVLYRFDFGANRLSVLPGSEGLWSPRWSRDGQFIAALGSPVNKLMLYDLASHRQSQLAAKADYPIWAHNGQYVYFRDDGWRRVGLTNRKIERIADLNDVGALPATPSRGIPTWISGWVGLAPDDSLLATSERGGIEIYSAPFIEH